MKDLITRVERETKEKKNIKYAPRKEIFFYLLLYMNVKIFKMTNLHFMKTINIKHFNKICGHTFSMFKQTSVDPHTIMFHYNLMLINQSF